MSRIFVSHASANNASALALASWLEANGWSDYFLDIDNDRGINKGERWMAALAGAVDRCEAVIFLVSPAWRDSKFCFAEFFEAKKLGKRIFGVIVEPIPLSQLPEQMTAEWQVCDLTDPLDPLPFTVSCLPWLLETRVDFPRAALEALARGLQNAGLDASSFVWPPEAQPDRSPYPGLRALDEMDAAVFFGRDAAVVRAIDQLRLVRERDVERAFVVLGASGAGKSSFLRAGLMPRLRRDGEHFIVLPPIRPERAAISGSAGLLTSLKGALAALGQVLSPAQVRAELATTGLAGVLGRIGSTLQRTNQSLGLAEPTIIVPIDQAEDLFAIDGRDEAIQFLAHLENLGARGASAHTSLGKACRPRILFLLTIRSDSLQALQSQPALQALSPVLFSLPAMPVAEFKAVIEGPARRDTQTVKPLAIAPLLTEQLVMDAQGADALPLLALTIEWLYREFTNDQGTRIGQDEYQRLGGVRGVIGMAVERAFARPGAEPAIPVRKPEQDRLLQQLLPYLATVDPDTGDWKRRVALRRDLRTRLPAVDALVSRLVEQRLLLVDSRRLADGAEPVEIVEVAHEALLRQWDALERWLREFGVALAASESIRRAANDWDRSTRDAALLVHTAHRLQAAEALLSDEQLAARFEPVDKDYLEACGTRDRRELKEPEDQLRRISEQQQARATLQRRVGWGLGAVAIVVLGLVGWLGMQTRDVSLQTSLVLTGAAEVALDQELYERSLRLGVLAARARWLRPADATARPMLARAADTSPLTATLIGHTDQVLSASFSDDGRRVLTASADRTARVWDAAAGQPIGQPIREGDIVRADFRADGRRVATAALSAARIWDVGTGKAVGAILKHAEAVNEVRFSRDGKRVVTASADKTARVWDAETGLPLSEPMTHGDALVSTHSGRLDDGVRSASFNRDGTQVVTASSDGTARVWNAQTGRPESEPMVHRGQVVSASFSEDGTRVVTGSEDRTARVWDALSGKAVTEPMMHGEANPSTDFEAGEGVQSARFSTDGRWLVTVADDMAARVWDAATGRPVGEPIRHVAWVSSATFSVDGRYVITASGDKTVRLWSARTGKPIGVTMAHDKEVASARFSADGKHVVTASWDTTARVWKTDMGRLVGEPMAHQGTVLSARYSIDGKRVVTASADKTARVWDAETGKPIGGPMTHVRRVDSAAFSLDHQRVITSSEDNLARIWNADDAKLLGQPMPNPPASQWLSPL